MGAGIKSVTKTRREVVAKFSLVVSRKLLPEFALGVVSNTSLPSKKNNRFSGKKVSSAVRFKTTSSASTAPKSGFKGALTDTRLFGCQVIINACARRFFIPGIIDCSG